jgi:hypothetical protein
LLCGSCRGQIVGGFSLHFYAVEHNRNARLCNRLLDWPARVQDRRSIDRFE